MIASFIVAFPFVFAPFGCSGQDPKEAEDSDADADADTDTDTDTDVDTDDTAKDSGADTDDSGGAVCDAPCYAAPLAYAPPSDAALTGIVIGDWDGGEPDVLVYAGWIGVFTNDGTGALASSGHLEDAAIAAPYGEMVAGTFDSDDLTDLAVAAGNDVVVLFGNGAGGVTAAATTPGGEGPPVEVAVADLPGTPPTLDLLALATPSACGAITQTSGGSGGGFVDASVAICTPATVGVLARTSPSHGSVLAADGATVHQWLVTSGPGTVGVTAADDLVLPAAVTRMVAFDVDEDADADVFALLEDGTLALLLSDGADGWVESAEGPFRTLALAAPGEDLVAADVDGDSDRDLVVSHPLDDSLSLLLLDGDAFPPTVVTVPLGAGAAPGRLAAGDLNSDGVEDLAVLTAAPQAITVLVSAL